MRMLMNNLDAEVAENPHELVVYGGIGRAARTGTTSMLSSVRLSNSARTRRYSFSRADLSAFFVRTLMHRGS